MKEKLFDALGEVRSFFPDETSAEHEGSYDEQIAAEGGIDLCLNAIGEDGHTFGFNSPGSAFDSRTRLVSVSEGTGMSAKQVLVLVSGKRKAEILRRIMKGPISPDVPATILRQHPNCQWIVDEAAASRL
jgi:glucosamine-6-phosphate deaminase